jgi:acetyltransferase-like isoleucine patch superfamily enzyme
MEMKWRRPIIIDGRPTEWGWIASHVGELTLGEFTDIGAFAYLQCEFGIVIEDWVQIGAGCKIYSKNTIDNTHGKVIIRKRACIGANSVVLPGVTIGEGALVAALSLVNKDVPDFAIMGGIPIKMIQSREDRQDLMWSAP